MYCPSCGLEVVEHQKFCQQCGQSLQGVTDATTPIAVIPDADAAGAGEPGALPVLGDLPTRQITQLTTEPAPAPEPEPDAEPASMPVLGELPTHEIPAVDDVPVDDVPADEPPVDEVVSLGELPTQEIRPRDEIPDPDWATPTGEAPVTPPPSPELFDDLITPTPAHPSPAIDPHTGATTTMGAVGGPPGVTDTNEIPAVFDGSEDIYEYPPGREQFKLRIVFILAFFGAVAVLMSAAADVIDIRTSAPVNGIATGIRTVDSLGTNLAFAGFCGAAVMTVGGLMACFGFRWGAGLAGGAGLALVGWAALVLGLAELRIASAESITRQTSDVFFTLKVTRDLGFWLIVAVAAIGLLVFVASLRMFGTGGQPALNPWIAALGAVAGVVLAAGPLLPEGNATFRNNFRSATQTLDLPAAYFGGRLAQLGLIAGAVVFGFLVVRAYGLGLAAGGVSVSVWLWVTSLADIGNFPLGVAAGNFGSPDTTPHAVTTVGMVLTVLMLIVAAVLATIGNRRTARH